MTVEDIKKEIVRLQDVTKDIKVSVGCLRSDINQLSGAIKQDDDEFEARLAEAESRGAQKGYEKGFAEGRTRKDLSEAQDGEYQRGCNDAWDMAKRITLEPRDYKDSILVDKMKEVFGTPYAYEVFQQYEYQEVVSMLNATIESKDEIRVGDIVRYKKDDHLDLYVLKVYDDKISFKGLVISDSRGYSCGDTISLCYNEDYVKTGRHHDFNKILEFLKS